MKLVTKLIILTIFCANTVIAEESKYLEVRIPNSNLELCDKIVNQCEVVIKKQEETILLLDTQVKELKKNKPKSNWLLWLLGGVVTGLVISNGQN